MVYILLATGFETAEALAPADVLRRGNVPVSLVGVTGSTVTSAQAVTVTTDVDLADVTLAAGDMVMLPGGLGGVDALEHDEAAMALIRQAAANPEVWLCAICAAPTLLARAGLIPAGANAVCYPGMEGDLVKAGAVPCMDKPFVVGDHLITGRAAGSSFDFGLALLTALAGADVAAKVQGGIHYQA